MSHARTCAREHITLHISFVSVTRLIQSLIHTHTLRCSAGAQCVWDSILFFVFCFWQYTVCVYCTRLPKYVYRLLACCFCAHVVQYTNKPLFYRSRTRLADTKSSLPGRPPPRGRRPRKAMECLPPRPESPGRRNRRVTVTRRSSRRPSSGRIPRDSPTACTRNK